METTTKKMSKTQTKKKVKKTKDRPKKGEKGRKSTKKMLKCKVRDKKKANGAHLWLLLDRQHCETRNRKQRKQVDEQARRAKEKIPTRE